MKIVRIELKPRHITRINEKLCSLCLGLCVFQLLIGTVSEYHETHLSYIS